MWIVPSVLTRARLARLVRAATDTGMTAEAVCLADIREPLKDMRLPANWTVIPALGPLPLAETARIAGAVGADPPFVGILPPDHIPRTRGWDRALAEAAGRWSVACCNDLVFGGRDPVTGRPRATGAVCLGGGLAREMGRVVPDGMGLADARIAWMTVGRRLGRLNYLPGVTVERPRLAADEQRPWPASDEGERRARLFRWLNDEARPLVARVREAVAREAVTPGMVVPDAMAPGMKAGADARRAV